MRLYNYISYLLLLLVYTSNQVLGGTIELRGEYTAQYNALVNHSGEQNVPFTFVKVSAYLVNVGSDSMSVITAVNPISHRTSSLVRFRYRVSEVNSTTMKPSVSDLRLVDLGPGEAAYLGEWHFGFHADDEIPPSVTLIYEVDERLATFYNNVFVGELVGESVTYFLPSQGDTNES